MAQKETRADVDTGTPQLKPVEVAEHRERLRREQNNTCPLCKKYLKKADATLDHDHGTGHIRHALHRNCNSVEGRVLHWVKRSGVPPKKFLESLLKYWSMDYSNNPLHPNHKTEKQKKATIIRKRLRRAKRASTKARLKQELQEHLNE